MRKKVLLIMFNKLISSSKLFVGGIMEKSLVWWSHDNPTFVNANKKFIAHYEKMNPDVKINLQIFPYDAMVQKLKAAYAGKNPPDIAQTSGSWVHAMRGMTCSRKSPLSKVIGLKITSMVHL